MFLVTLSGSYLWSCSVAVLQHFGFQLEKSDSILKTTEGLLTKRRIEIPLTKIQIIEVQLPFVRRLLGYGSMHIETAALGYADGEVRKSEGFVPMLELGQIPTILEQLCDVPEKVMNIFSYEYKPPHLIALYRSIFQKILKYFILTSLLFLTFRDHNLAFFVLFYLYIAVPLGYLDWKYQGWYITKEYVFIRAGFSGTAIGFWIAKRFKVSVSNKA